MMNNYTYEEYRRLAQQAYDEVSSELNIEYLPTLKLKSASGSISGGGQHGETIYILTNTNPDNFKYVIRHELAHWQLGRNFVFGGAHDRYFFAASAAIHTSFQHYIESGHAEIDALQPGVISNEFSFASAIYNETKAVSVEQQIKNIASLVHAEEKKTLKYKLNKVAAILAFSAVAFFAALAVRGSI
jgi:hypothetical protein